MTIEELYEYARDNDDLEYRVIVFKDAENLFVGDVDVDEKYEELILYV